jgi:hypothetical protein
MAEFDPFIFFRELLVTFLTIYTLLVLTSTIWRLKRLFAGEQPDKQILRLYVSYQMLTIRLAPLRGELLQIGFWLVILLCVWWLHTLI